MPPKNRIIIDTDPGVDDVLALLLALSSRASDLEVLLVSLVNGNVDVHSCLRNAVATFHTLEKEISFRRDRGLLAEAGSSSSSFEGVTHFKPLVAIGAAEPLQDPLESDFFHGRDGLAGIHATHPHLSPQGEWKALFREEVEAGEEKDGAVEAAAEGMGEGQVDGRVTTSFTPSLRPAHREILRLLRENDEGTVTLIAIGPLTNMALAAAEEPETFLRAKELVIMGGTVVRHGNVTPVAEFNVYADPYAAARVFALTSPSPNSTLPLPRGEDSETAAAHLKPYPETLTKQLRLVMLGLDITEQHVLPRTQWEQGVRKWVDMGSPLAVWMDAFMKEMLDKMERIGEGPALALHDPMCVFYVLTRHLEGWASSTGQQEWEDIRVECRAQWTRGMTVGDTRPRRRRNSDGERTYDHGNWLGGKTGNRVIRMVKSPGEELPAKMIMDQLFG
jgi:inosine-uridine nucleoside N-ribohydrolase